MLDMAKPANKPASVPPPEQDAGEGRQRIGQNLNVWIPDELMAAWEAYRKTTRRTKTAETVLMMEEYLKARGLWPPAHPSE